MEIPTKEQVYSKYLRLLEKKGFFKTTSEEERAEKSKKAEVYFAENYDKLHRLPQVKVPKTLEEVLPEKLKEAEEFKISGNELFIKKDYATAICEYSKAISCNPFNHIYYSNRAACYSYLENFELASRDCEKCVEISPSFAKGFGRLAVARVKLGKLNEAKEAIDKALSLDPTNEVYLSTKQD
ncbi:small glutamine rich tetratricopeptide repeat-containing protein, partial [Entamoeba invadens IP1]|uniref:small glutamine rich tetratricopeptide repeat-containing protein n=1 Tax=Entamoeba invadens IP1 TaxID=370355 RepID=UPI0002C3F9E9